MHLKRYKREFEHSYAFGTFPVLELLTHRPERALRVVAHSKGAVSSGIDRIEALCGLHHAPFEVNDTLVERLSHKGNVYVFAAFEKYETALNPDATHLMLVNPSDMGNAGTIMRTMLGFGVRDLVLVPPAVDPFNPHVVRASMGALFALNTASFDVATYEETFTRPPPSLLCWGPTRLFIKFLFPGLAPSFSAPRVPVCPNPTEPWVEASVSRRIRVLNHSTLRWRWAWRFTR